MFDVITAITTNLFRTVLIKRFMSLFFDEYSWRKQYTEITYVLFYVVTTTLYLAFHYPPLTLIGNIVMLYVVALTYQSSHKKKILAIFFVYAINMVCEVLAVFLLSNYVVGEKCYDPSEFVNVFLVFICEFIFEKFIVKNNKEKQLPPYWYVILMIPIISIMLLFYLVISNLNQRVLMVVVCSAILFINILIFFLYHALVDAYMKLEEGLMYEKQMRNYSNQLDVMMQTETKVRMLHHDMKHHLMELFFLAGEQKNGSDIENYILNMSEFMENHHEYTHSGNKDVDSVLNYMLDKAEKVLTKVEYKINIPEELKLPSFDLNVILGNLLENAIDGASTSKEKELSIVLNYDKGMLFLDIWNSYDGKVVKKNGTYLTTKSNSEGHGIGLGSIKKVVEKYNGTMKITDTNNIFDVRIMLYTLK